MKSDVIPVVLFAYKRPDHLQKVLDSLKINNVPLIYVFCDGPKDPEESESINKVRQLINKIDWCEIHVVEHPENIGLARNIRTGISWVMNKFDKVVVVEDDIVFKPGAYNYVTAVLRHYENSEQVMSVSMWSDDFISSDIKSEGYFSKRFVCWGWGTYRKYWQTYTDEPQTIFEKAQHLNLQPLAWGSDIKAQAEEAGRRKLWYVGYLLQHFINGKISYFPKRSLVINIGTDGSGENIKAGIIKKNSDRDDTEIVLPVHWPAPVVDNKLAKRFARFFEHRTKSRLFYFIQRLKKLASAS